MVSSYHSQVNGSGGWAWFWRLVLHPGHPQPNRGVSNVHPPRALWSCSSFYHFWRPTLMLAPLPVQVSIFQSLTHLQAGYAEVPRGRFDSHYKWILNSYRQAAFCLKWMHYSYLSASDHTLSGPREWLFIDLNGSHISYAPISCWHCIGLSNSYRGYDDYSTPPCLKILNQVAK